MDQPGAGQQLTRLLVVTAVAAERDAIARAVPAGVRVVAGGVGPACSAATTARLLALSSHDPSGGYGLVLAAGIGGGFGPVATGDIAVASSIVFADLGAETDDGFTSASALGFGQDRYDVHPPLAELLAGRTGGRLGTVLTVATVTGTAGRAAQLRATYPNATAEAMEGAGIAAAASQSGVRFGEIRAVSNLVGPRDRSSWRIPEALAALAQAFAAITAGAGWDTP